MTIPNFVQDIGGALLLVVAAISILIGALVLERGRLLRVGAQTLRWRPHAISLIAYGTLVIDELVPRAAGASTSIVTTCSAGGLVPLTAFVVCSLLARRRPVVPG